LAEFVKRFHQEAVLIPDLEDGVVYTSFLNGLRFKFSLVEQKETTLAEALRKAANFIRATKICAESMGASKKAKILVDGNAGRGDRRPRLKVMDPRFTTNPRSILMEVKENPMLKKSQPMTIAPKPHNAQKYCEFHEQNGHTTVKCKDLRKILHELDDKGRIDHFFKRRS